MPTRPRNLSHHRRLGGGQYSLSRHAPARGYGRAARLSRAGGARGPRARWRSAESRAFGLASRVVARAWDACIRRATAPNNDSRWRTCSNAALPSRWPTIPTIVRSCVGERPRGQRRLELPAPRAGRPARTDASHALLVCATVRLRVTDTRVKINKYQYLSVEFSCQTVLGRRQRRAQPFS